MSDAIRTVRAWRPGDFRTYAHEPDREDHALKESRIRLYQQRAASNLPLFAESADER